MRVERRTAEATDWPGGRITTTLPLRYREGEDHALDRSGAVRAASGAGLVAGRIAVVQDDTNFIALVDPATGLADALTLPPGADGRRRFEDQRGNKRLKLDLEACIVLPPPRDTLIAFGSGSSAERERVVIVHGITGPTPSVEVVDAHGFYESLRSNVAFAGSDLNIEGAVYRDGSLTLFGRGNGESRGQVLAVNATCTVDWPSLERYLERGATGTPPDIRDVVQYDLGSIEGIPLGFTDAALRTDSVMFTATAEASPDARRDGRVAGSVLGLISPHGRVAHAPILERDGRQFGGKVEAIVPGAADASTIHMLADHDDPSIPSELCTLSLPSSWGRW